MAQYNKKTLDKDRFEKYCNAQNKEADIATFFNVSTNTLNKWCIETYNMGYKNASKMFNVAGRSNVKRKLYEMAMAGNTACIIFYCKNHCDMSDNPKGEMSMEAARDTFAALKQAADNRMGKESKANKLSISESNKKDESDLDNEK